VIFEKVPILRQIKIITMELFNQLPLLFNQLLLTLPDGNFLISIVVSALAFFIAAQFLEGVQIKSLTTAAFVAIIVAFANAALVEYLVSDYGVSVSGFLGFITNAVVIMIASALLSGFKVKGVLWAIILAVVVALLNGFLFKLLEHFLSK